MKYLGMILQMSRLLDRGYEQTMLTVPIGSYEHWRITNRTNEVHPFHIHQVHFLVYASNGERLRQQEWLDTVNVSPMGSVHLGMYFTDPIIQGPSLFHYHLPH